MSARKLSESSEEQQESNARPPVSRVEYAPTIVVQEKVLAEIAHELGNFFHKLYYWSDFLKERQSRKSADSTAAQMLERTIKNLEDFLKLALDYVHPTQLSFMRMGVSELLEGLMFQVRAQLNGTPVAVGDGEDWRGVEVQVLVDPSHLSHAFEVAVRHLTMQVGPASKIEITIERAERRNAPGLEVEFRLHEPNEASPLFRTAEVGVEWAVAQKVVALHGGELSEHAQDTKEKELVFFLPLCPS
jgi:signal transduction histidine kinase